MDRQDQAEHDQIHDYVPLENTRMPKEVFRKIGLASQLSEEMKQAAWRVLVLGWAVSAAGEAAGVAPSTVARACRAILRYQASPDARSGPVGAFAIWFRERVEAVPPKKGSHGLIEHTYTRAKMMRADLASYVPEVSVPGNVFGRLMRSRGHASTVLSGVTYYFDVRLKASPVAAVAEVAAPVAAVAAVGSVAADEVTRTPPLPRLVRTEQPVAAIAAAPSITLSAVQVKP